MTLNQYLLLRLGFLLSVSICTSPSSLGLAQARKSKKLLPTPPIMFIPTGGYHPRIINDCDEELSKPTKAELNERRLVRRLGEKVDLRFLSVTKPQSDTPTVERISLSGVTASEKAFLKLVIRNESESIRGSKMAKASTGTERFLMKWLVNKRHCPVRYTWKELGFCYWPRWVLIGECVNKPCSWPSGMSCVPSNPSPLFLLRWHCNVVRKGKKRHPQSTGKPRSRSSCKWYKFSLPITTECKCKCDKNREKLADI